MLYAHDLPRKDTEFLLRIVNFPKYLSPSLTRLNFPSEEYPNRYTGFAYAKTPVNNIYKGNKRTSFLL